MMKKIFVLLFLLISLPVKAKENDTTIAKYQSQLEACNKEQEKYLETEEGMTTAGMKYSNYEKVKCYKNIVYDILKKYYPKYTADEIKERFDNYVQATFELYGNIYLLNNECPENCGTIFFVVYTDIATDKIEDIVENFIHIVEITNN